MAFDQLADAAKQRGCNAAFLGHMHVPVLETEDGILLVNPGKPRPFPRHTGESWPQLCGAGDGRRTAGWMWRSGLINKKYYIEKKKCRRVVYSATNEKDACTIFTGVI